MIQKLRSEIEFQFEKYYYKIVSFAFERELVNGRARKKEICCLLLRLKMKKKGLIGRGELERRFN